MPVTKRICAARSTSAACSRSSTACWASPWPRYWQRLPLSQRILQALLEHSGPYHPALQLARALESADTRATRLLCESYGYAPEDVNRALLRALATLSN